MAARGIGRSVDLSIRLQVDTSGLTQQIRNAVQQGVSGQFMVNLGVSSKPLEAAMAKAAGSFERVLNSVPKAQESLSNILQANRAVFNQIKGISAPLAQIQQSFRGLDTDLHRTMLQRVEHRRMLPPAEDLGPRDKRMYDRQRRWLQRAGYRVEGTGRHGIYRHPESGLEMASARLGRDRFQEDFARIKQSHLAYARSIDKLSASASRQAAAMDNFTGMINRKMLQVAATMGMPMGLIPGRVPPTGVTPGRMLPHHAPLMLPAPERLGRTFFPGITRGAAMPSVPDVRHRDMGAGARVQEMRMEQQAARDRVQFQQMMARQQAAQLRADQRTQESFRRLEHQAAWGRGPGGPGGPGGPPGRRDPVPGGFFGSGARGDRRGGILERAASVAEYTLSAMIVRGGFDAVGRLRRTTSEVDKQMRELDKILLTSQANLDQLRESAVNTARQYGLSTMEVLRGYQIFAQQGYGPADVARFGRAVARTATVSELPIDRIAEVITVGQRVFGPEVVGPTGERLIDQFLKVASEYAISEADLAEVFQRIGPMAAAGGISVSELNALTTVIKESTRSPAGMIGTSLRFMLRNLQDISNLQQLRPIVGETVRFTTDVGDLRNPVEILRDIAEIFPTLSKIDQMAVAQRIGETRFTPQFLGLMQGFERFGGIEMAARLATGETERRSATVLEGLQKQTEKTMAAFEGLSITLGDKAVPAITSLLRATENLFAGLNRVAQTDIPGVTWATRGVERLTGTAEERASGIDFGGLATLASSILLLRGAGRLLGVGSRHMQLQAARREAAQMGLARPELTRVGRQTMIPRGEPGFTTTMAGRELLGPQAMTPARQTMGGAIFDIASGLALGNVITGVLTRIVGGAFGAVVLGPIGAALGVAITAGLWEVVSNVLRRVTETGRGFAERTGLVDREVRLRETARAGVRLGGDISRLRVLEAERERALQEGDLREQEQAVREGTIPRAAIAVEAEMTRLQDSILDTLRENEENLRRIEGVDITPEGRVLFRGRDVTEDQEALSELGKFVAEVSQAAQMAAQLAVDLAGFSDTLKLEARETGSALNLMQDALREIGRRPQIEGEWDTRLEARWRGTFPEAVRHTPFLAPFARGLEAVGLGPREESIITMQQQELLRRQLDGRQVSRDLLETRLTSLRDMAVAGPEAFEQISQQFPVSRRRDMEALMDLIAAGDPEFRSQLEARGVPGQLGPMEWLTRQLEEAFIPGQMEQRLQQPHAELPPRLQALADALDRNIQSQDILTSALLDLAREDLEAKMDAPGMIKVTERQGEILRGDIIKAQTEAGQEVILEAVMDRSNRLMLRGLKQVEQGLTKIIAPIEANREALQKAGLIIVEESRAYTAALGNVIQQLKDVALVGFGAGQLLTLPEFRTGPMSLADLSPQAAGTFRGFEGGVPQFDVTMQRILAAFQEQMTILEGRAKAMEVEEVPEEEPTRRVEAMRSMTTSIGLVASTLEAFGRSIIAAQRAVDRYNQFLNQQEAERRIAIEQTGPLAALGGRVPQVQIGRTWDELSPQERLFTRMPRQFEELSRLQEQFRSGRDLMAGLMQERDQVRRMFEAASTDALANLPIEKVAQILERNAHLIFEGADPGIDGKVLAERAVEAMRGLGPADRQEALRELIGDEGEITSRFNELIAQISQMVGPESVAAAQAKQVEATLKSNLALERLAQTAETASARLNQVRYDELFSELSSALGVGPESPLGARAPAVFVGQRGRPAHEAVQLDFSRMTQFEQEEELIRRLSSPEARRGQVIVYDQDFRPMEPITEDEARERRRSIDIRRRAAARGEIEDRSRQQISERVSAVQDTLRGVDETLRVADLTPEARRGLEQMRFELMSVARTPASELMSRTGEVRLGAFNILDQMPARLQRLMTTLEDTEVPNVLQDLLERHGVTRDTEGRRILTPQAANTEALADNTSALKELTAALRGKDISEGDKPTQEEEETRERGRRPSAPPAHKDRQRAVRDRDIDDIIKESEDRYKQHIAEGLPDPFEGSEQYLRSLGLDRDLTLGTSPSGLSPMITAVGNLTDRDLNEVASILHESPTEERLSEAAKAFSQAARENIRTPSPLASPADLRPPGTRPTDSRVLAAGGRVFTLGTAGPVSRPEDLTAAEQWDHLPAPTGRAARDIQGRNVGYWRSRAEEEERRRRERTRPVSLEEALGTQEAQRRAEELGVDPRAQIFRGDGRGGLQRVSREEADRRQQGLDRLEMERVSRTYHPSPEQIHGTLRSLGLQDRSPSVRPGTGKVDHPPGWLTERSGIIEVDKPARRPLPRTYWPEGFATEQWGTIDIDEPARRPLPRTYRPEGFATEQWGTIDIEDPIQRRVGHQRPAEAGHRIPIIPISKEESELLTKSLETTKDKIERREDPRDTEDNQQMFSEAAKEIKQSGHAAGEAFIKLVTEAGNILKESASTLSGAIEKIGEGLRSESRNNDSRRTTGGQETKVDDMIKSFLVDQSKRDIELESELDEVKAKQLELGRLIGQVDFTDIKSRIDSAVNESNLIRNETLQLSKKVDTIDSEVNYVMNLANQAYSRTTRTT